MGGLGSLYYCIGEFDLAAECFQKALMKASTGPYGSASLEGLARVRLAQNRLEECGDLLERIEKSVQSESDRAWYVYRDAQLTRAYLLAKEDRLDEAIAKTEAAFRMAVRVGDGLSARKASLAKAELH